MIVSVAHSDSGWTEQVTLSVSNQFHSVLDTLIGALQTLSPKTMPIISRCYILEEKPLVVPVKMFF